MRIDIFVDLFESGNTTTPKLQVALMATEIYLSSKVSKVNFMCCVRQNELVLFGILICPVGSVV